ncbi:protein transport protein Sec16A-like isoform X1 [Acipenser ruthenus]|uniref:protein transport protein Sec16A-like isoform X1 n=1 Tax=Acipenser ruthenus TaxID=7906 RepID=UPI0027407C4B|nr:protein transport protein Sec16A-like isoform X1 [Acipenser ruthenus]
MQPPPRAEPPGAAALPPVGVPNVFRRSSPYSRRANVPMSAAAAPVPPMTDPFAFGRQTPQNTPLGNPPPKSSPVPVQGPPPSSFTQPGPIQNQFAPTQTLGSTQGLHSVPSSSAGVNLFTSNSCVAPSPLPGHFNNSNRFASPTPHVGEQEQLKSREHSPFNVQGSQQNNFVGPPHAAAPLQNRPPYGQDIRGDPISYNPTVPNAMPFPAQNMQPAATSWMPDYGSCQPSAQNYFQPGEHPAQQFGVPVPTSSPANIPSQTPPQNQMHSEQQPQVGQQNMTPFLGFVNSHPPPDKTEGSNPPVSQHHNPPFQSQNHFSQNYGSSNTWFNQPHQEHFYQQPGAAETNFPPTNTGQAGLPPEGNHIPYESDTGTVSMFFKGNEVENEETLASEKKAMNSVPGGELFLQSQGQPLMGVDVAQNAAGVHQSFDHYVTGPINALSSCETGPYLNDSAFVSEPQKNAAVHFDNVENLECAPNLEVLPSNPLNIPPMPQTVPEGAGLGPVPGQENLIPHVADNFEGGPNLETPDSVLDRPVRSESVSSSYSNVSHGSASSSRRPQGVVGTFIQQEIAKPPQEVSAGYFEQVDSSPAGDAVVQNAANNVYHRQLSQPPTPSPPKPTGIFQASANSSFEPVRSYSVGVKPVEVDQARMVMEKNSGAQSNVPRGAVVTDASPGNLEQPPDNLENIFMPTGQPPVGSPSNVLQPISKPTVETVQPLPDRRPSSRAHAPRLKCESPATTLWAQNEIMPLNILLAPAAPPVHVFKQPSMEIIQPPEDSPLDQPLEQQAAHKTFISQKADVSSENLENPPQGGEGDHLKQQASFGYATLLVSSPPTESFQNQPILIAHPTQNYSVVPPNNPPVSLPNQTDQVSLSEPLKNQGVEDMTVPVSQAPGINLTSGANAVQPGFLLSTSMPNCQPQLISVTPSLSGIVSNQPINLLIQPPPNQNPLNLTLDSRHGMKPAAENTYESAAWPSNQAAATDPSNSALGQKANLSVLANNSQSQPAGHHQNATNHVLLDFTMPRTQANQNQDPNQTNLLSSAGSQPPPPSSQGLRQGAQANNPTGFYLQVTKDAQQSAGTGQAPQKQTAPASQQTALNPQQSATQPGFHVNEGTTPTQSVQGPGPQNNQYPQSFPLVPGPQGVGAPNPPMGYGTTGPGGTQHPMYPPQLSSSQPPSLVSSSQQPPQDLQRPTPSHTPQQMYGPPPQHPAAGYGYYGGGAYPEYPDGRHPYQQPYPPGDPRTAQPYYQEDPYRRYDPRYVRYEGYNPGYREGNRSQYPEQQERPSSRASQYSDRPSSRQGYSEDNYLKGGRSAYDDYYADYYKKQYDYGDRSQWDRYDPASYDPRYREYYEQQYWYNYDPEAYRRREQYYSQQYPRREGYDDRWQYDPRYDSSFDDENAHPRDPYGDEYDRRSVHSEQSAHSVHSSHSQQSRRSSFSSRSQQSQVYRSQQDLVTAGYEAPSQPAAPADYSYGQYTDNVGGHQGFTDYQYPAETGWQSVEQVPPRPVTPEKFTVPHICARFGPGGQLIKVLPNLPSEGQPALVEIHSMETMLQSTQEQEDLRAFPGPLAKEETHKVDVIKFSQNKAMECLRNDNLLDKDSASLIWEFIVLLCRQNGTVVGTDIADLLLRDHKSAWLPGKSPNETNLIDFNNEALDRAEEDPGSGQLSLLSDTFMSVPENAGKETERFRELLLFGRKKDSLECAMKHGLWGHALLLASKMDSRTHARVMTRFANSLPINDPLQTVYQLMSGRMPAAATCCGDEKWGDWRPHLAMVLSNLTNALDLDTRTISTMGDTLASKGLMDAAHFCYMMAQVGFGVYTKKSTKLVLLGSNHSLPFFKFASNEAIQRTEAYEYAQSLGSQTCLLPNFQVFKFIYACRLAEVGLSAQAFHYCEVISRTVLKRPSYYSPVFINQLIQMSAKLRFFDPQLKERPEQELFIEPDWLVRLHQLDDQIKEGAISYNSDRATPQQYACSTPSSEFDHTSQTDGIGFPQDMTSNTSEIPLMTSLMPNAGPPVPGVQLMPPAPQTILDGAMPSVPSPQYAADVPFNPGPPQMQPPMQGSAHPSQGPMQGYAPPAMNPDPGFGAPYLPEQSVSYTGTPLPPQGSLNEALPTVPEQQQNHQPVERRLSSLPSSPTRNAFPPQGHMDFYDQMVHMAPGRRSRSTSQSSMHMGHGRRSRTTSESSSHSIGRDRRNSAGMQPTPPPPSIPEQPTRKPEQPKKDSPKKGGGGGWLSWLTRKGKNEAHLPDDKNKSIVWDEKKQRWVNQDEPEEESKPLPPPPPGFPKMGPQMAQMGPGGPPGSGPQVNMFSRKAAGTRGRYVDILNPGGVGTKPRGPAPAPADLFAPLAPMPIPANLFVPSAAADGGQSMEGSIAEAEPHTEQSNMDTQFNPAACPPGSEAPVNTDGTQSGELSRSSSMSSLSREVSQHFKQAPDQPPAHGGLPAGGVTFYNPSQFMQPAGPSAGTRAGRFSQRKYPAMK